MDDSPLFKSLRLAINLFEKNPSGFVVNVDEWRKHARKKSAVGPSRSRVPEDFQGVPVFGDGDWKKDRIGVFFDADMFRRYQEHRMTGYTIRESIRDKDGKQAIKQAVTPKIRWSKDGDPPWTFVTQPVKNRQSAEDPDENLITLSLRPEFAVYVLSSLEVIREVLDQQINGSESLNVKSRAAAIEVLCSEIARALDEQASREKIDDIINDLIDRYTQ